MTPSNPRKRTSSSISIDGLTTVVVSSLQVQFLSFFIDTYDFEALKNCGWSFPRKCKNVHLILVNLWCLLIELVLSQSFRNLLLRELESRLQQFFFCTSWIQPVTGEVAAKLRVETLPTNPAVGAPELLRFDSDIRTLSSPFQYIRSTPSSPRDLRHNLSRISTGI